MEKPKKIRAYRSARSYEVRRKIVSALIDIYRTAQLIQLPHVSISARVNNAMYESPEYARLQLADKLYIQGYRDALQQALEQTLIWMKFLDGEYRTTAEVNSIERQEAVLPCAREVDYRGPWHRIENDKSRFVYRDIHGDPMRDKPWK